VDRVVVSDVDAEVVRVVAADFEAELVAVEDNDDVALKLSDVEAVVERVDVCVLDAVDVGVLVADEVADVVCVVAGVFVWVRL